MLFDVLLCDRFDYVDGMLCRVLIIFLLCVDVVRSDDVTIPDRAPDAVTGREFSARIATLDLASREREVLAELRRGNVPAFWRKFVEVKVSNSDATAVFRVAPDYFAIGTDDDYFLIPMTPMTSQTIADDLGCTLPTRKMVDEIWHAAALKLAPAPIPPTPAMITVPIFVEHNATVRTQRTEALPAHPLGTLVAGHKKDVVVTPQLAAAPGKVAIYGWHRADGRPIQPLHLGHTANWVDYSHGVRFVARDMTVNGLPTTVEAVLADAALCPLLSDEGPITNPRYAREFNGVAGSFRERSEELHFDPGVRVIINSPADFDAAKPVRLVLYAVPAGNTIEQTIGRQIALGEDWHFDIQHIGAQTRWLRARQLDANLVVAYLECSERSWVLWRRKHSADTHRIPEIVETLRGRFAQPVKLVLTGHSAGGAFTFSWLDGIERIPDNVERIAFLDSNYAYDVPLGHAAKLANWLDASAQHFLCVLAYEDHVALLNGKPFVSERGGTWGRSHAMLHDLAERFAFGNEAIAGLQRHTALEGRVQFLLKENPEKAVLHTRLVEWNGFIHALLSGTPLEGIGYNYLGPRAYEDWITVD